MEHRCNTRRPVVLEALIECRGLGRVPGRIRNISLGGVFVETGRQRPAMNSIVDLCFSVPYRGGGYRCRISAMVVHRIEGGIGLMFEDLSPQIERVLRAVIDAGTGPSRYRLPVYADRGATAG